MDRLKNLVKLMLYGSGAYTLRRRLSTLSRSGPRLLILVYHNLTADQEYTHSHNRHFQIRPQLTQMMFERQMSLLSSACPVLPLAEGVSALKSGSLRQDSAVITFDDGYRSFKDLAFPVLDRLGLPATMFLATDYIESLRFYWWDELHQVFFHLWTGAPDRVSVAAALGLTFGARFLRLSSDSEAARKLLEDLEAHVRYLPDQEQQRLVAELRACLPDDDATAVKPEPLLDWDDIRALTRRGVTFGSHTCTHFGFAHTSGEQMDEELTRSRARIESEIDCAVTCFAYPYGGDLSAYRPARIHLERAGYKYARTTQLGYNDARVDPLLLNSGAIGAHESIPLMKRDLALGFVRTPGDG